MFRKSKPRPRDKKALLFRFITFIKGRREAESQLRQPPRTLAEALRDSGALMPPQGRSNLEGGW